MKNKGCDRVAIHVVVHNILKTFAASLSRKSSENNEGLNIKSNIREHPFGTSPHERVITMGTWGGVKVNKKFMKYPFGEGSMERAMGRGSFLYGTSLMNAPSCVFADYREFYGTMVLQTRTQSY